MCPKKTVWIIAIDDGQKDLAISFVPQIVPEPLIAPSRYSKRQGRLVLLHKSLFGLSMPHGSGSTFRHCSAKNTFDSPTNSARTDLGVAIQSGNSPMMRPVPAVSNAATSSLSASR
jgi:hypothetical protein